MNRRGSPPISLFQFFALNAVKSFGSLVDNSIKEQEIKGENGLVMRSKRNRFSAGGLVLCTVGWCEREVTLVYQTGKEMRVISSWNSGNFIK